MSDQPPPAVPPVVTPKTSGLAIASLVFGILGLICLLPVLGSALAIIFGAIALGKVGNSRGQLRGRGQAMAGLVLGCIGFVMVPILAILAGMLLPALSSAREKARRVQCLNNEKQIALAMQMYTVDHDGKCPRTLDNLRQYVASEKVFHCPSACTSSEPNYQIFCGTNVTDVVIREDPEDHRGAGGNVAYGDGHVEWVNIRRSSED